MNVPGVATSRSGPIRKVISPSRMESPLLPALELRGRPAARRGDGLPLLILAAGVLAGRGETAHVADDGHDAALADLANDGSGAPLIGCCPTRAGRLDSSKARECSRSRLYIPIKNYIVIKDNSNIKSKIIKHLY